MKDSINYLYHLTTDTSTESIVTSKGESSDLGGRCRYGHRIANINSSVQFQRKKSSHTFNKSECRNTHKLL